VPGSVDFLMAIEFVDSLRQQERFGFEQGLSVRQGLLSVRQGQGLSVRQGLSVTGYRSVATGQELR